LGCDLLAVNTRTNTVGPRRGAATQRPRRGRSPWPSSPGTCAAAAPPRPALPHKRLQHGCPLVAHGRQELVDPADGGARGSARIRAVIRFRFRHRAAPVPHVLGRKSHRRLVPHNPHHHPSVARSTSSPGSSALPLRLLSPNPASGAAATPG